VQTFEQIKAQIEAIPQSEYAELHAWFIEQDAASWDREIEQDSESGALDSLIDEAAAKKQNGRLREICCIEPKMALSGSG
jgi:hypothetical protein